MGWAVGEAPRNRAEVAEHIRCLALAMLVGSPMMQALMHWAPGIGPLAALSRSNDSGELSSREPLNSRLLGRSIFKTECLQDSHA